MSWKRVKTPFGEPWQLRPGPRKRLADILDASGAVVCKGVEWEYAERIVDCVNALVSHFPEHLAPLLAHVDQDADLLLDSDLCALLDSFNGLATKGEQQG